jgi:hypothetical protein
MAMHSSVCQLATADWLRACGAARRLLPVEGPHVIRPADLYARARQLDGPAASSMAPPPASQALGPPGKALEGCFFTLAAMQVREDHVDCPSFES